MNKVNSSIISLLRFPLIVGVVCIHCEFGSSVLQNLLGEILGRVSVPLFLLISGYLFFIEGSRDFPIAVWKDKIKRRVYTLLIPYLLWNFIGYIIYACRFGFSISDFFHSFWIIDIPNRSGSSPIDGPLWYVRNLMVLMLVSPFISLLIKYTKYWALILMGLLWIFQIFPLNKGIGIAFLFFSVGGYLRMYRVPFEHVSLQIFPWAYLVFLIGNLIDGNLESNFVFQLGIILGILTYVAIMRYVVSLGKGNSKILKFLSESSFFIYCLHDLILQFLKPIFSSKLGDGDFAYVSLVVVEILLCVGAYSFLRILSPRFLSLLMGKR